MTDKIGGYQKSRFSARHHKCVGITPYGVNHGAAPTQRFPKAAGLWWGSRGETPCAAHSVQGRSSRRFRFSGSPSRTQRATSGNFGYSVDESLVLGYLPVELLGRNDFAVEAFGKRNSASVIRGAVYDPKRKKILC